MMDYLDLAESAIFIILIMGSILATGVAIDLFLFLIKHTVNKRRPFFDTKVEDQSTRGMSSVRVFIKPLERGLWHHPVCKVIACSFCFIRSCRINLLLPVPSR